MQRSTCKLNRSRCAGRRSAASALVLGVVFFAATAWAKDPRPNVLFIMSDDHTTQAIGAYGGRLAPLNPTPTLDRMASEGMRFDRVFCHNAICTPSRANIMTGQYSMRNEVYDLRGSLPEEQQYLAVEMKRAGYETAMIGKWHLKEEPAAFDYYCVLPGQGDYHDPQFRVRGRNPWPENTVQKTGHSSDVITDVSLAWLRQARDRAKPFFLMHHFKAPHDMFEHAARYDAYLEDVSIPEPANMWDRPDGSIGSRDMGSGVSRNSQVWGMGRRLGVDENLADPHFGQTVYQAYLKRYLRCVKGVDDNLKRLLDYLAETGELENTIILYTGDQGFFLGEHDLIDKRWMYEEAMRMPLIVRWPTQIRGGTRNDWLINNTDFAPTLLELAGVESTPNYMQGRSFAGALRGEARPTDWRTATYYRYWMHLAHNLRVPAHFGIRTDRYKLIFFYGANRVDAPAKQTPAAWELYDLKTDPHEMHNVYGDPKYDAMVRLLKTRLREVRKELDETDDNFPHIQRITERSWDD
ncbi:sulfatase [Opitutaceae bacterium]|nr:sulfatase [Opitutaceae bacterium]